MTLQIAHRQLTERAFPLAVLSLNVGCHWSGTDWSRTNWYIRTRKPFPHLMVQLLLDIRQSALCQGQLPTANMGLWEKDLCLAQDDAGVVRYCRAFIQGYMTPVIAIGILWSKYLHLLIDSSVHRTMRTFTAVAQWKLYGEVKISVIDVALVVILVQVQFTVCSY